MRQRHASTGLVLVLAATLAGCDEPSKAAPSSQGAPSASAPAEPSASSRAHSAPVVSAEPPPRAPPAFTPGDRAIVLEDAAKQLEDRYVSPQVGVQMANAIRQKAQRGGYDAVATEADLAHAVTDDLLVASHDPHVTLEYEPFARGASSEEMHGVARDAQNKTAGGFGVGGRLPGNIERVVIDSFEPVEEVRAAVEDHMSHAADADGMLVDLRDNTGGDPATVALVASYLFDGPRVHLDDVWWRSTGSTEASWTVPNPPGKRFGGRKPIVVLTSAKTSPRGEELAYDLQAMHRASVVGEKTAGVAHPVALQKLASGFTLRVPIGRVVNPVTKKDWEGVGVQPDVETTAVEALKAGYIRVLRAVIAGPGITEATRKGLKAALLGLGEQP